MSPVPPVVYVLSGHSVEMPRPLDAAVGVQAVGSGSDSKSVTECGVVLRCQRVCHTFDRPTPEPGSLPSEGRSACDSWCQPTIVSTRTRLSSEEADHLSETSSALEGY